MELDIFIFLFADFNVSMASKHTLLEKSESINRFQEGLRF